MSIFILTIFHTGCRQKFLSNGLFPKKIVQKKPHLQVVTRASFQSVIKTYVFHIIKIFMTIIPNFIKRYEEI